MPLDPPHPHSPSRRQAAWVVAWRVVGIATTFAANILAARLLGPVEFGSYLLVMTIIALGGLLGMAGLNEAGLRFIAESLALDKHGLARAYLQRVLSTVAIASLVAAVITAACVLLFQIGTARFHEPALLIAVAGVGVIVLAWQQISAESLRGFGDLRSASLFSGGQTGGPISNLLLLIGLAATPFAAVKLDATWAVALTVGSIALTFPFALGGLWRTSKANHSPNDDQSAPLSAQCNHQLLAVGGVLLLNQILAFVSQQLDIWLGGSLLAPEALGLYGAAKRSLLLAAMPVQMAMMIVMASIPRLQAQGRTRELERVVRQAATYAAVPALVAIVLLALFPETILRWAFGGSYAGAAPTVLVLTLGYLVLVLSGNPPYVLTMTGHHRTVVVVNLIAAIVLLVFGAIGAKWYGAPGLAAGSAASFALQNGLLWWFARRRLGISTHVTTSLPWLASKKTSSLTTIKSALATGSAPEA